MRSWFSIVLAASLACALPAMASPTTVEGKWAVTQNSGVRLPIGTCKRGEADQFSIEGTKLLWFPPARFRIPSLRLEILSRSTNVSLADGQVIRMLLNVEDRAGKRGEVWISGSMLFMRFKEDEIELQFESCG